MGLKFDVIEQQNAATIKVVGVGGCGNNALNTMIDDGIEGVEFIAVNTDKQVLANNLATLRLQLGVGLGAGGNPEAGKREAENSIDKIKDALDGANMVFVTAGMGGGTGSGAAPVVAKAARDMGALVVGVVTKPFLYEGRRRMAIAEEAIVALRDHVDTIIVIPNQKLLAVAGADTTLMEAFKKANDVLLKGVRSIADLIIQEGHVNLDFADVNSVMKATESSGELALMGTGQATGDKRAVDAAAEAISCPLMENVSIDGARGVLINITGGLDLRLSEVNEASELIMKSCSADAAIYWGQVVDPTMEDAVRVTVIATGFDEAREQGLSRSKPSPLNRNLRPVVSESRPRSIDPREEEVVGQADHVEHYEQQQAVAAQGGARVHTSSTHKTWSARRPGLAGDVDAYDMEPAILRNRRKPD
jgi:cell division protein FtsZ